MKVFIADDSEPIRSRLMEILSELEEIEVIGEARDVPEAIASIRRLKPDVVILDIRMPGGSGLDVLKFIHKARLDIVVIVLTNYPFPQYRKRFKNNGAKFFFDKAEEFEKIIDVLKRLAHKMHVLNKL
jgi:DNA-binding NarL/FixJ family response regulator